MFQKRFAINFITATCLFLLPVMVTTASDSGDKKAKKAKSHVANYGTAYYSQVFGFEIGNFYDSKLFDKIDNWLGTPYQYAGHSMSGVDCSGLVKKLLSDTYGITVEGGSANIYEVCKPLSKDKLLPGDLVFFKTRKGRISHVGFYLGENKFVHSSSSQGVIISDLDESYWQSNFYKGGRLDDLQKLFADK